MSKVTAFPLFLLLLFSLAPAVGTGQSALAKADRWYKEKAYARAIPLYEAALREKFRVAPAQKLARAYRLTNAWEKAEALLDTLVTREKVSEDIWLIYAEALLSNGQYQEAREWFLRYAEAAPRDTLIRARAEACLHLEGIPPVFGDIRYAPLPFNSAADDHAAVPWREGLIFTSDRDGGRRLFRERSAWTGRHYLRLYYTQPLSDSTWSAPEAWSGRINALNLHAGYAVFAPDSQTVYFTRNSAEPNEQDWYPLQLFQAPRTGEDRWGKAEVLPFSLPIYNMMHPAISPEGHLLAFASDRPGGQGGLDIWICQREGEGWSRPRNAGPVINTSGHEGFPFLAAGGRLYFASRGHPGFGGFDLFESHSADGLSWSPPRNLGRPLNSPLDDITFYLLPDGSGGYFSSTRDGGDDDLYRWWRTVSE